MGRKLLVVDKCPLCGGEVERIPDAVLKQNPHQANTEMVLTRTGIKQYIHTDCWYGMIKSKRPYNGKFYM